MNRLLDSEKKVEEGFLGQRMKVLPPDIRAILESNMLTKDFHLTAIGFYPHAKFHCRERKSGSKEFILLYCLEGKGSISIKSKDYELGPNSYFILPKDTPHKYQSSVSEPWSIHWMHFTGNYSEILFYRYANNYEPEAHQVPYEEKRIENFNQIFSILDHGFSPRDLEISSIKALDFISSLIYFKENNPSFSEKDSVSNSIRYMKKNLHLHLSIEQLAQHQKYSISYYTKIFKSKTGKSPIQYLNLLKIQKSCQYLYFTDSSVKEICSELGINDPYYFSRLFKNFMGMSPANYRKAQKNKHDKVSKQ